MRASGVAGDLERDPGSRGTLLELGRDVVEHGSTGAAPSATTRAPDSSSRQEQHLVDQLADLLDLAPSLVDEVGDVLAREQRELEQREETGEGRPELVRDRGREARAQLLVGRHVADAGEVDEPLLPTGDGVGDDERVRAVEQLVGKLRALPHSVERLAGAATGGEHHPVGVDDDHGLAALLEQHAASFGVRLHAPVVTEPPSPDRYRSVTLRQPLRAA